MQQITVLEKYPVFTLDLPKAETACQTVDDVVAALRACIDADQRVAFIAVFDHFAHTKKLGGPIDPAIVDAKNLVFCFGLALPNANVMAVRPRSIGIADLGERFVINFMEAPMPPANLAMEAWVKGLRKPVE